MGVHMYTHPSQKARLSFWYCVVRGHVPGIYRYSALSSMWASRWVVREDMKPIVLTATSFSPVHQATSAFPS